MYRYCSSSRRCFYWRRCEIETLSLNLPILSSCSLVSSSLFRLLCSRRKRFESRGFSLFRVLLQIEVVRVQNRVRRDQRFVRYIIAERAGQNERRQSCMFTRYIRRRRRSTKGSVILRIDVDDIECYMLLSGKTTTFSITRYNVSHLSRASIWRRARSFACFSRRPNRGF